MVRKLAITLILLPFLASAGTLVDVSFTDSVYMVEGSQLRHAAQLGDVESQFQLGWQYSQRKASDRMDGFHYNPRLALHWYRQAARQGHAVAAYNLAVIYAQGRGIAADPVEAYAWLDYAADEGHGASQNLLPGFRQALTEHQIQEGLERQQKNVRIRINN